MQSSLLPGLLSVTFRAFSTRRIIELAREAQVSGIEWGGDLHVPHGDCAAAEQVRRWCEDEGLVVNAYGSYFRAEGASQGPTWEAVLDTTEALHAPVVRVWAGIRGSREYSRGDRAAVTDVLRSCCEAAAHRKLVVATEFHVDTLTDDIDSALQLLQAVNCPNLRTFWQPPNGMSPSLALYGLRQLGSWLSNIHVFHWWPDAAHRLPLSEGGDRWPLYLQQAFKQVATDLTRRYVSLEFVRNDDVNQFRADAATLRQWLADLDLPTDTPTGETR